MKKILITGGAGFLGSHLCKALYREGHSIVCLDNFLTGSLSNLDGLEKKENFEFIEHDLTQPFFGEFDEIYNLACPASPIHYQNDPVLTVKTNVLGSIHMLGLAKKCQAKILQASTSEIYGDPLVHPQVEGYFGNVNTAGPRACYDEGKRCAETLFFDYHRQHQLKIKVLRIFNTYGPHMHVNDGRVVSNFIIAALKGEDIIIHGSGSQSRSFIYVSDMVDAMIKLMATPDHFIGPINVGNPVETSIKELAEFIIKLTNSSSKILYTEGREDDPVRRLPDITLAKKELGWKPTVELEAGLISTIEYFKQIL